MPIRVLLADDHEAFREGVRRVLESCPDLEVVGEAGCGLDAVQLCGQCRPDVALLDVRMKPLNGIQAIPQILTESPRTAVLMLSMHADKQYVIRSVAAGAKGYLLKDCLDEVLIDAVHAVHAGKVFFSPEVAGLAAGG